MSATQFILVGYTLFNKNNIIKIGLEGKTSIILHTTNGQSYTLVHKTEQDAKIEFSKCIKELAGKIIRY